MIDFERKLHGPALAVLVALTGCHDSDRRVIDKDRQAFTSTDSWYAPPPRMSFTPIDRQQFATVIEVFQPEAQAALADSPVQRLTNEEATRLVGRRLPAAGECFLLRSIVLFEGTGRFDIGVNGTTVHVHHGSLGRRPAPMTRKALVAVLPAMPETVFVSCSMAE